MSVSIRDRPVKAAQPDTHRAHLPVSCSSCWSSLKPFSLQLSTPSTSISLTSWGHLHSPVSALCLISTKAHWPWIFRSLNTTPLRFLSLLHNEYLCLLQCLCFITLMAAGSVTYWHLSLCCQILFSSFIWWLFLIWKCFTVVISCFAQI